MLPIENFPSFFEKPKMFLIHYPPFDETSRSENNLTNIERNCVVCFPNFFEKSLDK